MLLSIIIVNYKSTRYILDCLQSAESSLIQNKEIEWIIVDNDSKDDAHQIISNSYPQVQFVQMGYNAGFARANNAGIRIAKAEQVLLLNPDTLIVPGMIEQCLERLIHSNHVAAGVQLIYPNHQPQFSGSYFMLGGLNHLLPLPYWGASLKAIVSLFTKNKPAIIQAEKEQEVDWVSGAFLMVKQNAIKQSGLMDEDFFLYGEEVEWCSRLKKIGTICIYGDLQIIHLIGQTIQEATQSSDNGYTNLSDKKGLQLMLSNHLRIRKQYGVIWFLFQLLNYTWAPIYAYIMSFILHLVHVMNPFTDFKMITGVANNVIRLWAWVPSILMGKKQLYKAI